MTALSEKALAFSVDNLLGKKETPTESRINATRRKTYKEELCASMGEEQACCHSNTIEVQDQDKRTIRLELCQPELWEAFHRLGTEMIITKTGRRMFPAVRVRISGLNKAAKYRIHLEFVCVDKHKYRYVYHSSKWMVSGIGECPRSEQSYLHPDSPMTGDYTAAQVVSFEKIKLTNNDRPSTGQVSLLSMQKFQPRIVIEEVTSQKTNHNISVTFPQTAFIAVTAYQNQEITRLKIARNPFAKGFREAGKCRSSLEAMMASFGVVINPGSDDIIRKRHLADDVGSMCMDPYTTPPKRPYGLWMPSYVQYPGLQTNTHVPFNTQTSVSALHAIYSDRTIPDSGKDSRLNTHRTEERVSRSPEQISQISPKTISPSNCQVKVPSIPIHPSLMAWSLYGQSGHLLDQRQLANYYQGLLCNPLSSAMYSSPRGNVIYDARGLKSDVTETAPSPSSSE